MAAPAVPAGRRHAVLARAVPMTLLMGATVVVSWVGIRGRSVFTGPGPWFHESWFLIWVVQALLVAGLVLATEWLRPSVSRRASVEAVMAGWSGELLVVVLLLTFLVGELDVVHAPAVWLIATGFGIQPGAAILGALMAHHRREVRPDGPRGS